MTTSLTKEKLYNVADTITPASLYFLQKIGEYKGKQILYTNQQPEYLDKLQIDAIIENTVYSNAIDNIHIKHNEFIELFEEQREPETDVEAEIIRYVKVQYLINSHYESLEISPELLLQFHRNLFRYKEDQGGKWKPLDNILERTNRDGTTSIAFIPVSAQETPATIEEICLSYESLIKETHVVDLVAIAAFILDFLCVHPFTVGNGRVSRLLTQLLFYKHNYQVARYISLDKIIYDNRAKYLYNLNKASQGWHDQNNDISCWIEYFLYMVYLGYSQLDKQIFRIKNKKGAKSKQVRLIIDSMPKTFKVADIIEKCQGISRPTVNKVLQEMRDENLLMPLSMGRDALWEKNI
jgi:Fic family protein